MMIHREMLNQVEANIKSLEAQLAEAKITVEDTRREYDRANRNYEIINKLLQLAVKTKEELKAIG